MAWTTKPDSPDKGADRGGQSGSPCRVGRTARVGSPPLGGAPLVRLRWPRKVDLNRCCGRWSAAMRQIIDLNDHPGASDGGSLYGRRPPGGALSAAFQSRRIFSFEASHAVG